MPNSKISWKLSLSIDVGRIQLSR